MTAHRAVALAHLDNQDGAARTVKLKKKPGFTREFAKQKLFYLKRAEQLELYLDGLENAGVPLA